MERPPSRADHKARQLIEECEYYRRLPELEDAEKRLAPNEDREKDRPQPTGQVRSLKHPNPKIYEIMAQTLPNNSEKPTVCWLQISAGRGPAECGWVVGKLAKRFCQEAETAGLRTQILATVPDQEKESYKSILLSLQGATAAQLGQQWIGTVQWIGQSPFRPTHKRKNWFVSVEIFLPPAPTTWSTRALKIETMRASGPGGQHVNKVETAVRITHLESGVVVTAAEERSQQLNRKLALARLQQRLAQFAKEKEENARQGRWQQHNELERGNPVRVFQGQQFTPRSMTPSSVTSSTEP